MSENLELRDYITVYTRKWIWFVLSLLVFITLAYFYMRYTTPLYIAQTTIEIAEDKDEAAGLNLFKEIDFFAGAKNKIEDEMEIINSRSNLIEVRTKSFG